MTNIAPYNLDRLGFHYFPDTQHYQDNDLRTWLPELKSLGASWLTLIAPNNYAIPEPFLSGLLQSGIEPVLHFRLPFEDLPKDHTLPLLFSSYAKWGVKYIVLFDRPNLRAGWSSANWAQTDLVERFLDIFLPLATACVEIGLRPVFPPLEPGGDYWDTAFLRAALQGIQRRGNDHLLDVLILGAYAWADTPQLNWGAGGPERWPSARPYFTPPGQQDQRGFYIFDWYRTITQAVLGQTRPILLIGAGSRLFASPDSHVSETAELAHARRNLAIARSLTSEAPNHDSISNIEPIHSNVIACNFWVISTTANSPYASQAWFQPDGTLLPAVEVLREWIANRDQPPQFDEYIPSLPEEKEDLHLDRLFRHYLLLPLTERESVKQNLDLIQPYVAKHHPTIGFSVVEASHAHHVTIVGGASSFPEGTINDLLDAGCIVEEINSDGTSIATQWPNLTATHGEVSDD